MSIYHRGTENLLCTYPPLFKKTKRERKKKMDGWLYTGTEMWESKYNRMLIVESKWWVHVYWLYNCFNIPLCLKHFIIKCPKIPLYLEEAWFWGKRERAALRREVSPSLPSFVLYGGCMSFPKEAMKKSSQCTDIHPFLPPAISRGKLDW